MDRLCRDLAADLERSFPDLVRCLQSDVVAGLRRLHGSEAEDLAQETFIRAYRALQGYDRSRIEALRLRGWIWTIALNLGRNHARDRARRPRPVELEDRHAMEDPEPVDRASWDLRLSRLSGVQRRAVILRHVVGLTYEELAHALDRPIGTVKADVHRGLTALRNLIEEEA